MRGQRADVKICFIENACCAHYSSPLMTRVRYQAATASRNLPEFALSKVRVQTCHRQPQTTSLPRSRAGSGKGYRAIIGSTATFRPISIRDLDFAWASMQVLPKEKRCDDERDSHRTHITGRRRCRFRSRPAKD
jgi:hypothetical protein